MFSWFTRSSPPHQPLTVDLHSHLLPGIDDGVKSLGEAEEIILSLAKLGYTKLITTPHVMSDTYRNTTQVIQQKLLELTSHLEEKKIDIKIQASAEYYLDEALMDMISANEQLLTFGKKYLLFETPFLSEPLYLKEFIFAAVTKGYTLVLAHPERYIYLQRDMEKMQDLLDRGVLFQLNINSITGHYSPIVQKAAYNLIDRGWIHFLGSDCHHIQHVKLLQQAHTMRYFKKALTLPILNNTLL